VKFHTVAVDFLPPPVIGAAMSRIAGMLARGGFTGLVHLCESTDRTATVRQTP
jgi:hypothetical protein